MASERSDPETGPPEDGMVAVLAVDDDPEFLRVTREVVRATPGFTTVAEASTGEDAVSLAHTLRPGLVLMDVRMPGIGGIEAARRIGQAGDGRTAVVLMSADAQILAALSMPNGTVGVVSKERLSPSVLRGLWND